MALWAIKKYFDIRYIMIVLDTALETCLYMIPHHTRLKSRWMG
jgi:hypothetical protein